MLAVPLACQVHMYPLAHQNRTSATKAAEVPVAVWFIDFCASLPRYYSSSFTLPCESGGKGNAAEADRPLPEAYRQLFDLFTATDHAYCFLVKNSIPPRVSSLQVRPTHGFC